MIKYLRISLLLMALFSCQQHTKNNGNKMDTIFYIDRESGEKQVENIPSKGMLKWLYSSTTGKVALHILFKRKVISKLGGCYMNSRFSAKRIANFISDYNINLQECELNSISEFTTFNQFFYRKLKENARKIGTGVVSPADGKILVFQSQNDVASFFIKGTEFTLEHFLQNKRLAEQYKDGAMAIIRLAPPDYHRFHFPTSGKISESTAIEGHYFSVSPLALRKSLKIFCENYREYSILESTTYGNILISDVGATMVGSIVQTYTPNSVIKKGHEKGYFAFGGSTLVLLFEKGKIAFDKDLIENTQKGLETSIRMGETIAQ